MKRFIVSLSAVIAFGLLADPVAHAQAPPAAPAPAPAPAKPTGRVAVFNVAQVMRDYKKWQHYAAVMNQKRVVASADLGKLRNDIAEMQKRMQAEPLPTKQEEIMKAATVKQREFEDKEKQYRKALDEESAGYLRNLYSEIQACVKAIVEANGFDLVMAYPDAISEEELNSPLYYDLKLRPQAAMPFYVAPSANMTAMLIATLNNSFPAPAPVAGAVPTPGAVTPAGGTSPAPMK